MECTLKYSEIKEVCRTCMKHADTFHNIKDFQISDMISGCTSLHISIDDELPNRICGKCFDDLQYTFQFVQTCQTSDNTFRHIINEYKISIKASEPFNISEIKNIKNENSDSNDGDDFNQYMEPIEEVEVKLGSDDDKLENDDKFGSDSDDDDDIPLSSIQNKIESKSVKLKKERVKKSSNGKKYVCEKCDLKYDKAWLFGFHMKRVHKSKGIKCEKCPKVCWHKLHIEAHMDICHNETKNICDICQRHFSNRFKLDRHKSSHVTTRLFHCLLCNNSFKDNWVLTKHIRTIHENPEKRVSCEVCSKTMLPRHLERHLLLHEEREKIKCKYCPKLFFYAHTLDIHTKRVHEKTLPSRNFKYLCNLCGRGVASQAELERHNLTHTGEKPYHCEKCDKKYRTKAMLRTHDSRIHMDVRNFKCELCAKAFYDRIFLENHMRVHTGERPFACDTCDKKYKTKSMLATHISRTHLNKRKFQCPECPKSFHEKRNISTHLLTHTGEKPFKCDTCEKCYSSKSALSNHVKAHKNIKL